MSKKVKIYKLGKAIEYLDAEFSAFKRKVIHDMADLDKSVEDVTAAEAAAEVRVKAAEDKAAAAQATAEANAKAAQDAQAALQAEIDSIKAGNAADVTKLAAVKVSLDAINADPVNPINTTDTGTVLTTPPAP